VQQAQANYDATVATYRETTLEAFQQVEDKLGALRILAQEVTQQRQAVEESQYNLKLFTILYEGGADPYLQVVTTQTTLLFNQRNEIDILRRQMEAGVFFLRPSVAAGMHLNFRQPVACPDFTQFIMLFRGRRRSSLIVSISIPIDEDNDASIQHPDKPGDGACCRYRCWAVG
jgi:hypothetical protein